MADKRSFSGTSQRFLAKQMGTAATVRAVPSRRALTEKDLDARLKRAGIRPTVSKKALLATVNRIDPARAVPMKALPPEIPASIEALAPSRHSFHGTKVSLAWFRYWDVFSPCGDRFGYMSSTSVRNATKLDFNLTTQAMLNQLGDLMGNAGREGGVVDSTIPAGFTYVGQFVDHDITMDVSSSLQAAVDANSVNNMRTPALDLDSVYGRGPALDPFLYVFPASGPATAIKMQLGVNRLTGPGGPAGDAKAASGMQQQTDFDVPRVPGTQTAIIGDPRNDENLIISQFHQAMLRLHNVVVDTLIANEWPGDIFVEARNVVRHHYQWAVVHDFLERICGPAAVNAALAKPTAINAPFRMPVEFAAAAYRFGHSQIRDNYWVNFKLTAASLGDVFQFIRVPQVPVLSCRVVDFNAFFDTGVFVPVNNKARPIDSVLANGLESLPGFSGLMSVLARRNLLRGLALGLPSGQGMAGAFGVPELTSAEITQGLSADEVNLLNSHGGMLLEKTPLWYYILREAAVLNGGNQLGPVGGRIVAETFVRMLKRDPTSYLNMPGFMPVLPSAAANDFTFADLVTLAGVTQP